MNRRVKGVHLANGDQDMNRLLACDFGSFVLLDHQRPLIPLLPDGALVAVRYFVQPLFRLSPRTLAERIAEIKDVADHWIPFNEANLGYEAGDDDPKAHLDKRWRGWNQNRVHVFWAEFTEHFRELCPGKVLHFPAWSPWDGVAGPFWSSADVYDLHCYGDPQIMLAYIDVCLALVPEGKPVFISEWHFNRSWQEGDHTRIAEFLWELSERPRVLGAAAFIWREASDTSPDHADLSIEGTPSEEYFRAIYVQATPAPAAEPAFDGAEEAISHMPNIQVGTRFYPFVGETFPDDPDNPFFTRDIGAVTEIVIHHSVTAGQEQTEDEEIRTIGGIYEDHRGRQGWPGIGYHALIFPSGNVYLTGRVEDIRAHVLGHNDYTYGVCLIGTFTNTEPTAAQLGAARRFIGDLRYGLGAVLPVKGHRDYMATSCPGDTRDQWWPQLFDAPAPTPPAPEPELGDATKVELRQQILERVERARSALDDIEAMAESL